MNNISEHLMSDFHKAFQVLAEACEKAGDYIGPSYTIFSDSSGYVETNSKIKIKYSWYFLNYAVVQKLYDLAKKVENAKEVKSGSKEE